MALGEGWRMLGVMMAKSKGQHWYFSDQEIAILGSSSAKVLRHMPLPVEQMGLGVDIGMLGVAVIGACGPRVQIDMAIAEDRRQRETASAVAEAQNIVTQTKMSGEPSTNANPNAASPNVHPGGQPGNDANTSQ